MGGGGETHTSESGWVSERARFFLWNAAVRRIGCQFASITVLYNQFTTSFKYLHCYKKLAYARYDTSSKLLLAWMLLPTWFFYDTAKDPLGLFEIFFLNVPYLWRKYAVLLKSSEPPLQGASESKSFKHPIWLYFGYYQHACCRLIGQTVTGRTIMEADSRLLHGTNVGAHTSRAKNFLLDKPCCICRKCWWLHAQDVYILVKKYLRWHLA